MKKVISLMLSLVMLMSITAGLNLTAYAETLSGSCGEKATYSLDTETGVLTISGTGNMEDFTYDSFPWYSQKLNVTSIVINTDVTGIGNSAFYGCVNLANVSLPNTLTSIGDSAFCGCNSLESISMPSSVTSIGNYAFNYCTGLKSISIPSSITSICNKTFSGCTGVTSITVDSNNTVYDSRDNCNAIIETATKTLMFGCQNTVIPNTVKVIGDGAFYGCENLEKMPIPTGVEIIDDYAFGICNSLTSVTIPSSVTKIGDNVFFIVML